MAFVNAGVITERVREVRARIERAGGDPQRVRIVAVTKTFGPEAIREAVAAGLSDIGENYAQEAAAKHHVLAGQAPGVQPVWHFIGQLQRNKVKLLAPFVNVWQTVDNAALINEIAKRSPGAAVFLQVNLSDDQRRGGCAWDDVPHLLQDARGKGLDVRGLMGVGLLAGPEASRPAFRRLAGVAAQLGLPEVSAGMSDDFEVAIQEGATMIRLGSTLFGPRS